MIKFSIYKHLPCAFYIFLKIYVVLVFPVLSNWVGLGSLLDSLDYLDLTSLGLGGGESSGRTIFLPTGNICVNNTSPSDLDLEELTNEVDGLETLAKEMEVSLVKAFLTMSEIISDTSPAEQWGKNEGKIDKDPRRET